MRRRTFLTAVGVSSIGSVGMATAGYPDDDEYDCDEQVEIVVLESSEGAEQTDEVPKAWHEQANTSRAVAEAIVEEHGDEPWFESVGRSAGEETICGLREMVITVYVSDGEPATQHLPDEQDGVKISIEEDFKQPQREASVGDGSDGIEGANPQKVAHVELPGFGFLSSAAAIGGVGYLLARRCRDAEK